MNGNNGPPRRPRDGAPTGAARVRAATEVFADVRDAGTRVDGTAGRSRVGGRSERLGRPLQHQLGAGRRRREDLAPIARALAAALAALAAVPTFAQPDAAPAPLLTLDEA